MDFRRHKRACLLLLLFLSFSLTPLSVFSDEGKGKKGDREGSDPSENRWKLELEGQVRLRGDFARNQSLTDFAFDPKHRESQFLERSRVQTSLENPALNMEAVVQGQWYGRWGGTDERSSFDLYQGYVSWGKILGSPVTLKAGRQEISYGSTFFIGPNDFYNGLSWDGFKVSINPLEQLDVDLLGVKMVRLNPGDPDIYLAGIYGSYKIDEQGSLETYLFYNKGGFPFSHREFQLTDSGQKWFTLGARVAGKAHGFDYELEPQFQWGKVRQVAGDGNDRVRAYGGHIDLGYTFNLLWETRLFGAYAFGSGDNNPFDRVYKEFHGAIFNDTYLVGDMSIITDLSGLTVDRFHASGIRVGIGGITISPFPDLSLTLRGHRFFANRSPSGFSRDLGTEVDLAVFCKPLKGMSFLVGFDRFFTGRFFEQASKSKKNIDYIFIQAQWDFGIELLRM